MSMFFLDTDLSMMGFSEYKKPPSENTISWCYSTFSKTRGNKELTL
jgi:hypothetical protein